jgi:hypothetical protein
MIPPVRRAVIPIAHCCGILDAASRKEGSELSVFDKGNQGMTIIEILGALLMVLMSIAQGCLKFGRKLTGAVPHCIRM